MLMYYAAAGGQLNVMKWLSENGVVDYNESGAVAVAAASFGHLDVLRWLHECGSKVFTSDAMDIAVRNNHLEVVEWLHVNRREGCTTSAMDGAAEYGHLDMVKWLHANRREGCTRAAMDKAAMNGHLEVVKWLHANRSEGCTTNAMDEAAGRGRLDILKWLHSNRTEGFTLKAAMRVAYNRVAGSGEVMKWLLEHGADGNIASIMDNAALNGNFEVVLALHRERTARLRDMWLLDSCREFLPWFFVNYPGYDSSGLQEDEMFLVTSATRYRDQLISYKTN